MAKIELDTPAATKAAISGPTTTTCLWHPEQEARWICRICMGAAFCDACLQTTRKQLYLLGTPDLVCPDCAQLQLAKAGHCSCHATRDKCQSTGCACQLCHCEGTWSGYYGTKVDEVAVEVLKDTSVVDLWEWLGPRDITQTLFSWYLLMEYSLDHAELAFDLRVKTDILARQMLNYVVLASAGEARHGEGSPLGLLASSLHAVISTDSREEVWPRVAHLLRAGYSYEAVLTAIREVLNELHFSGGYAGKKWLAIVDLGLSFAQGELTPTVFLDLVVDIVHNGGWAFDKYYNLRHRCDAHNTEFFKVLSVKRNARPSRLLAQMCVDGDVVRPLRKSRCLPQVLLPARWCQSDTVVDEPWTVWAGAPSTRDSSWSKVSLPVRPVAAGSEGVMILTEQCSVCEVCRLLRSQHELHWGCPCHNEGNYADRVEQHLYLDAVEVALWP